MKQFLIIYRRSVGVLELFEDLGTDRAISSRRRLEAELAKAGDPDIEVVVLNAHSEENVRRTHARYFFPAEQLLPVHT